MSARRRAGFLLLLALAAASCGDDGGSTTPESTTTSTSAALPSSTTTTEPAVTTTTERPLPVEESRSRIVVTGPEEMVFDWTTDRCEDEHIPDIAARAIRTADGVVHLTIGHYVTYRMAGPSLDELTTDCSTVLLDSDYDPDPAQFNDSEWIGSPYTLDGETIYAIAHNEYRGDTHRGSRPGQCPSAMRFPCLDTSFTMQISTDGGDTYRDIVEAPGHLVATLPYTYRDDTVPSGIRQPSNIVRGPDDYFYLFGNISDQPAEEQWVCAMRTDDLADPGSWRAWNGTAWEGDWLDPYREGEATAKEICAPLAPDQLGVSLNDGIVFDERLGRWVMVSVTAHPTSADPQWGVYYATSENLLDWTTRELLLVVPVNQTVADPDNMLVHAYPTIIDPDSPSLSFETSDGEMYLYLSRFNFGGNSLDRDLLRWPISVVDEIVPAPDWDFADDDDLGIDGWRGVNDVAPLTVADGALVIDATGPDPYLEATGLAVPDAYDRLRITMRHDEDVTSHAQLFFVTEDDPSWSEAKSVVFDIAGTGAFEDYELDLSLLAGWEGTILGIRLDPVADRTTTVLVDRVWFPVAPSD
ncbi:MAG: hypothetical protein DHS20C19_24010 [Acidimicrobiales bacterium]|nr:MAG: hypothetical protein DHS20C19_24010 [Acidimicrobiales bacterium]